jgi:ketosteroid isomerase-like protein
MSQENVELVRQGWEAFERGDMSQVLDLMSDDLVTHRSHPDAATYYGKEGYLDLTADWVEGFDEWSSTAEEFIDAGDRVVVRVRQSARGKTSGVSVESEFWFVFAIAARKVVRLDMLTSRDEALEAVGLSE